MKIRSLRVITNIVVLAVVTIFLASPLPVRAATYTVTTVDDSISSRDLYCDADRCTLRAAMYQANNHDGPDVIEFNIPGPSPHIIHLAAGLSLHDDDGTTIAGDSQPGFTYNLVYYTGLNDRGIPLIVLDASSVDFQALSVYSSGNTIRGLSIINTSGDYGSIAVEIIGNNNRIEKNFIGLSPDGTVAGNDYGIRIRGDDNIVADNIISGNGQGIEVWSGARDAIQGNLIGTDITGNHAATETYGFGITSYYIPEDMLIGGTLPAERNVISGFSPYGYGIDVSYGVRIINNYIGTNAAGTTAIPNYVGVSLAYDRCDLGYTDMCSDVPTVVQGNVVSGNTYGIRADTDNSIIKGNFIGTDATGSFAVGTQEYGIYSEYGRRLVIGGNASGEGNLISGNDTGIDLEDEAGEATVDGNKIGTNLSGDAAIPNDMGIRLTSSSNRIGGTSLGSGNLISGNGIGLWIDGDGMIVMNNKIGTNAAGTAAVPNRVGIWVNQVHEFTRITDNLIAFNTGEGVLLDGTRDIHVSSNVIHHNGLDGIFLNRTALWADIHSNEFRFNSTYDNGGLGINFTWDELNDSVLPPILTRISTTSVEGTACPNCMIDLYLSDRDPSGYGEGKTYLTTTIADASGAFHATFDPALSSCDPITATATNEDFSTSEFSRNVNAGTCLVAAPIFAWLWVLGAAAGGSTLMLIIVFLPLRRRRQNGPALAIGLGLLGAILGAGIGIGLLAMPFVHIQWPQEQQSGQAQPAGPSCGEFLNENLLQPADEEVFSQGTDVLFQLSPQPDPPGVQTRWFLEVTGPGNTTVTKMLTSTSIQLSDLGFDIKQTGIYFWRLRGERAEAGSNIWAPLCTDIVQRMFRIEAPTPIPPTVTPTATATNTPTVTPTVSPTGGAPTATLRQNAYCRKGPSTDYDILATLFQGLYVPIVGRNQDSTWWQVQVPDSQTQCWLAGDVVQTSGDLSGVPVVEPPPLGCWVQPQQGPKKCEAPCPENAQPGGACEP